MRNYKPYRLKDDQRQGCLAIILLSIILWSIIILGIIKIFNI